MRGGWARLAPLTGVIFVALLVVSLVPGLDTPATDASGKDVIKFFRDHQNAQRIGGLCSGLAIVAGLFFYGTLRTQLRTRTPDLAAIAFGGAILFSAGGAIFAGLTFALADVPDKLEPSAAQTLNVLNNDLFIPLSAGVCVLMLATALAIFRGRSLPLWLGWAALVIALVAVTPVGFLALFALGLWTVVVSILMYVRRLPAETTLVAAAT